MCLVNDQMCLVNCIIENDKTLLYRTLPDVLYWLYAVSYAIFCVDQEHQIEAVIASTTRVINKMHTM